MTRSELRVVDDLGGAGEQIRREQHPIGARGRLTEGQAIDECLRDRSEVRPAGRAIEVSSKVAHLRGAEGTPIGIEAIGRELEVNCKDLQGLQLTDIGRQSGVCGHFRSRCGATSRHSRCIRLGGEPRGDRAVCAEIVTEVCRPFRGGQVLPNATGISRQGRRRCKKARGGQRRSSDRKSHRAPSAHPRTASNGDVADWVLARERLPVSQLWQGVAAAPPPAASRLYPTAAFCIVTSSAIPASARPNSASNSARVKPRFSPVAWISTMSPLPVSTKLASASAEESSS